MNSKVVYTCLVGNYDNLVSPTHIMRGWDYICFSNDIKEKNIGIWEIRPIPFNFKNKQRLSRYVKLNPHKVLEDYEYSLYMDSNIEITGFLFEEQVRDHIKQKKQIVIVKHPIRTCIYREGEKCIEQGRAKRSLIEKQLKYYRDNGFPEDHGMYENNIILRSHNLEQIKSLGEQWWEEYQKFSNRDQLSLPFLFWKNEMECVPFFNDGISARNHQGLKYKQHNLTTYKKLLVKLQAIKNKINWEV